MLEPGDRFDRYLIEEVLGEGGMGRVVRAYDTRLERRVALKVLRTSADPLAASRMLAEAKAAAALDHPNAVHIHDVGEVAGVPYLAMELVTGRTLRAMADEDAGWMARLRWLLDAARALAAAHDLGIVHRDVKPDNVMVRLDGRATVLDFGVAHRGGDVLVGTAGTPLYMAPEQLRGHDVDGRADQFSWGVMAYEVLGGELPWGDVTSAPELVTTILHIEPRPLRDVAPGLPLDVVRVVERALAKSRDDRWPSMHVIVDVLAPIVGAEAKVAITTPEEAGKAAAKSKSGRSFGTAATMIAPSTPPPAMAKRAGAAGVIAVVVVVALASALVLMGRHRARTTASVAPPASASAEGPSAWDERQLGRLAPDVTPSVRVAVSPDGETIAFADGKTLRVRPTQGGDARVLPVPEGVHPSSPTFTPDGRAIIVATREPPGSPLTQVFLDGSEPRSLPGGERGIVSPDGQRIAIALRGSVRVSRLDGSEERFLGVRDRAVRTMAWSPSGDEVAVFSEGPRVAGRRMGAVEIFALDGRTGRNVADTIPVSIDLLHGLVWPTPSRLYVLAYTSPPEPRQTSLIEISIEPSPSSRTVHEWPGASVLDLAAARGHLYAASVHSEAGIALGRLAGDKTTFAPVQHIPWANDHAIPVSLGAADRLTLAVPEVAGDAVLAGRADDGEATVLARGLVHGSIRRGEGGALLAWREADEGGPCRLVRLRNGREEIAVIARSAAEGRDVLTCRTAVDCASRAPNVCVATVRTLEEWSVRKLDLMTGKMGVTLVRAHRMGARLSPDGKTLAIDDDEGRLSLVDVADGSARQLRLDSPVFVLEQSFAPDGKRLLFVGADPATWAPRLGTVDLRGHVEIAFAADDVQIDGVVTSDDGHRLAAALRRSEPPQVTVLEPGAARLRRQTRPLLRDRFRIRTARTAMKSPSRTSDATCRERLSIMSSSNVPTQRRHASWRVRACVLVAIASLTACATTAASPPSTLVTARAAYDRVSMSGTADLAPNEIKAAREELEAAEAAFNREGDTPATRDLANEARRKADYAESVVQSRRATEK